MQRRVLDEGDYFGVRAIEKGYYGGVAQTPPASGENSPLMSPGWKIIDSTGSLVSPSPKGSNIPEWSISGRIVSRAPSSANSLRTNASTITSRLQPSDAELSGRRNHDPAVTISTYVPTLPISTALPASPSRLEASTTAKENLKSITRVSAPPSQRAAPNRQVQSYAQWRLSAENSTTRAVSRFENKPSGLRSSDNSIDNTYIHSETGRRRSRSASSVEVPLRSWQGKLYARETTNSIDNFNKPSSSAYNSSNDDTQQSSPRHISSQDAECGHNPSLTEDTRSIKRTRDSLHRTKKFSAKPVAEERRARQLSKSRYDPSIYHRSDSRCSLGRIVELDKPLDLTTEERGDPKRESPSSSSISGSSTRSRSSSDATSVSSTKSMTESHEDMSEPVSKESCILCRRKLESQPTDLAAIKPIATVSISR